jgi:hypothetical protein
MGAGRSRPAGKAAREHPEEIVESLGGERRSRTTRRAIVCGDLARYETLTSDLIDDTDIGVARIVSHIALRPVRRFAGYPPSSWSRPPRAKRR